GFKDPDILSRLNSPPPMFVRRNVDLRLPLDRAVPSEEIGDVVDVLVDLRVVRPGNDVDRIPDCELLEEVDVDRGEAGQLPDRLPGTFLWEEGEELESEYLRKENEVALVPARHVNEVLALSGELVEGGDAAHLILNRADPHRHCR